MVGATCRPIRTCRNASTSFIKPVRGAPRARESGDHGAPVRPGIAAVYRDSIDNRTLLEAGGAGNDDVYAARARGRASLRNVQEQLRSVMRPVGAKFPEFLADCPRDRKLRKAIFAVLCLDIRGSTRDTLG
ncbi:hypothetical protein KM043_011229 [Ampulex compressa]|nr:hypothetical protein KM043_011229 [Ampulex compressa]